MTPTDLVYEINYALAKGPLEVYSDRDKVYIKLWGGELVFHDLTHYGSGEWFYNDTSG